MDSRPVNRAHEQDLVVDEAMPVVEEQNGEQLTLLLGQLEGQILPDAGWC